LNSIFSLSTLTTSSVSLVLTFKILTSSSKRLTVCSILARVELISYRWLSIISSFLSFNNTCSIFFLRSSAILRASKTSSSVWDETLLASVLVFFVFWRRCRIFRRFASGLSLNSHWKKKQRLFHQSRRSSVIYVYSAMMPVPVPDGWPWGISQDAPPPPSESVRMDARSYAEVITKFSRLDGLPIFLTHGASLARLARWSSAKKVNDQLNKV